jgi:hypothetical protein
LAERVSDQLTIHDASQRFTETIPHSRNFLGIAS